MRLLALMLMGGATLLSQAPPKHFELEVPEFQGKHFDSDVVELPLLQISKLVIHVLGNVADTVSYAKIYPRLNGNSASIICQYRSTARGKALIMDLRMRPDLRLHPGANVLEVTAINARGRKFYRNWVIRLREQARNEWFAYDYFLSPSDENAAPPDLLLLQPEYPIVLENNQAVRKVIVRGAVSALRPLASLQIHGAPWKGPLGGDRALFEQEVVVSSKDKCLVVEAVDDRGSRSSVTIPVTTSDSQTPLKLRGDRYALVIGISRYGAGRMAPPGQFSASADAEDFASTLKSKAGFRPEHTLVLLDERAQTAQIKNAFRNFVARAKPDDLLLIYFAGCGIHDPTEPDKIYLASYETQMNQLPETALEVSELESLLSANVRSRHTLLLFDVARAGSEATGLNGSNLISTYLLRLFSKDQGRSVMVSADLRQVSQEREMGGRMAGMFTRWMTEAVEGKADWNRDRLVTVAEIFRYVSHHVRQDTQGSQTPRYRIAEDSVTLASVGN